MSNAALSPTWLAQAQWLDLLPSGVLVSVGAVIRYANPMAAGVLGLASSSALIGKNLWDFVHPADQSRIREHLKIVQEQKESASEVDCRVVTALGGERIVTVRAVPTVYEGQSAVIATIADITDKALMLGRLRETDSNYRRLMDGLQDVYYRTDANGLLAYASPSAQKVLGYALEEMLGQPVSMFYPQAIDSVAFINAVRTQGSVYEYHGCLKHKQGHFLDVAITSHVLLDESGGFAGVEGIWRDVTESKRLQQQLQELVVIDQLTGCLNRRGVLDCLSQAFAQRGASGRRRHVPFSVLVLDLDFFKRINDSFGHLVGDAVLRGVVQRVQKQCRLQDGFGRIGGEEFMLVLDDADQVQAQDVAERIRLAVDAEPIIEGDLAIPVTVSIGVAQYHPQAESAMAVYERADKALYNAKAMGRNRVAVAV